MLVIERRVGEQILVGDGIVITLVWAGGGENGGQRKAKIGIKAPDGVRITRPEHYLVHQFKEDADDGKPGKR